ncbi:MAG: aminoglycoside 6'-N-acetyltransferase [Hyphomonadaceae bacterium]|nr:aminoglycoside 6'-N-acetyltransferase [Hyphomonadaceae bacterium]
MNIRPLEPRDVPAWTALRIALWADADAADLATEAAGQFSGRPVAPIVFVCEETSGRVVGMIEADIRSTAEGCLTSPVPYIEGWYVLPDARTLGVGRALVEAVEHWARERGYAEIASDALIDNEVSRSAHGALGYEETARIVCFRKSLS